MVDPKARRLAAQLLRDFISGRISNDAFTDGLPPSYDPAIEAIWDTTWVFYSDMREHRLTGRDRMSADQRRVCIRWLLFLHSDCPYVWPDLHLPGIDPRTRVETGFWRRLFQSDATLLSPEVAARFMSAGHYPVWPFAKVTDYKAALRNPRLLAGRR